MLRATTRFGLERNERMGKLTAEWPRWGFLNTAVSVFGLENVSAMVGEVRYGHGSDKPLEAILDDKPFDPNDDLYVLDGLDAYINRDEVAGWELPVYGPPPNEYY